MSLWDDIIKGGIELGANLIMQDKANDAAMDQIKQGQSGAGAQVGVSAGQSSATGSQQTDSTSTIDTTETQDSTSQLDTSETTSGTTSQTSQESMQQDSINETIQNILNNSQLDSSTQQQLESILSGTSTAGTTESQAALAGIFSQINPEMFSADAADKFGADASALAIQQALQGSMGEIAGMGTSTGTFGSTAQAQMAQLAGESAARLGTEANMNAQNIFNQNRQNELDLLLNAIGAGQAGQQQTSQSQQQQQTGTTSQTGSDTSQQTGTETGSVTGSTSGTTTGQTDSTTTGSTTGSSSTTGTGSSTQTGSESVQTEQTQEQAEIDKILSSQTDKTNSDWLADQFYGGSTGADSDSTTSTPGRENSGEDDFINKPKLPSGSNGGNVKGSNGYGN